MGGTHSAQNRQPFADVKLLQNVLKTSHILNEMYTLEG